MVGGWFVCLAHQFGVVFLYSLHAVVDDDGQENDGHSYGIAEQLKLPLSQKAIVTVVTAEDWNKN